ncbi:MAG: ubiE 3 [Firmicutes bacterium]|nr:ubiE 3 [Bacillota bacterium]
MVRANQGEREVTIHKFNPENRHKLDNSERRELLPPDETLYRLGLQKGDIMADIGCGIGYFTLPAAKIVGSQGKVYGMDTAAEMIEDAQGKIGHLTNVELLQVQESDFILDNQTISYAFICLVVHEVEDRLVFFREVARLLQPTGKIVIIEWVKKNSVMGPPMEHRLQGDEVADLLRLCSFNNIQQIDVNSEMYVVIGEREK